jgi:branched-subunit amino acid transport protein
MGDRNVNLWLVMVAGGTITFLTRLSFIAAEGRFSVPRWFRAMLPFVPVATLTALVAPALLRPGGSWDISVTNARLIAGVVAVVVAAVSRSVLLTISIGFAVFLGLHWLL